MASSRFDGRVKPYLNQRHENKWIGRPGPIYWPQRSPDLTPTVFFQWSLNERDDIQDQSALKKGTPASYWMLLSAHKRKVRE